MSSAISAAREGYICFTWAAMVERLVDDILIYAPSLLNDWYFQFKFLIAVSRVTYIHTYIIYLLTQVGI